MNLVTGATGHIGNVLVRELIRRNEKVRVLLLPGEDLTPLEEQPVEIVYGNVCDETSLDVAFKDVDYVFHLAGIISISSKMDPIVHEVNVEGTRNMADAAIRAGVKRFIYTSSIHAFKRIPHGTTITESVPIDPDHAAGAYDRSKAEATLLVLEKVKEGLPAVIACPTGVLGPFDFKGSELGEVMNSWINNKINYMIEGSYDFVDVRDVVDGLILAREKGKIGQLYILSGHLLKVADLYMIGRELLSLQPMLITIPAKVARFFAIFAEWHYRVTHTKPKVTRYSIDTLQSNAVIDNHKACEALGYRPRSVIETVADTMNWWIKNSPRTPRIKRK